MSTITLPNNPGTIQNTQVTDATKVMENFTAIVSEVNGNIDAVNLGALAVETAKIAALAVTAAKLATDAVETLKIKDANVTLAKMAVNSVDSDQYVDGSIDKVHLAADIIDGTKIGDDVLDSEHYVAGSIDAEHLASDAVETAKIKNLNVTLAKMAVGSIALSKTGIKIGNSTRSTAGDQIITGVGFRPSVVIFLARNALATATDFSWGFDSGTVHMCTMQADDGDRNSYDYTKSIYIRQSVGNTLEGEITAIGADGFTITWALTGTIDLSFIYLCLP
ncbi:hypothetical protein LCGC14_2889490 [marine sediment metagenome]|uniref:Tail fiber protein n=1 Tax=marine sediment metagenome TaxID=412755 RepID=A0A0F9A5N1_9ZZZZ